MSCNLDSAFKYTPDIWKLLHMHTSKPSDNMTYSALWHDCTIHPADYFVCCILQLLCSTSCVHWTNIYWKNGNYYTFSRHLLNYNCTHALLKLSICSTRSVECSVIWQNMADTSIATYRSIICSVNWRKTRSLRTLKSGSVFIFYLYGKTFNAKTSNTYIFNYMSIKYLSVLFVTTLFHMQMHL